VLGVTDHQDCPECGYPLTWSTDAGALLCAVYGTHRYTQQRVHPLVRELARPVVRRHLKAVG
jgi:uncharacterized Zn finger protein (UPF0148 family)